MKNERIGVIVPTRKDRTQLEARCWQQIKAQTRPPDHIAWIDFDPKSDEVDLIPRIRQGLAECAKEGCTQVLIMENDDYYPEHYIEKMAIPEGKVFCGTGYAWFYHIHLQRYQLFVAPNHSPLFCTGWRIDALLKFPWPKPEYPYLDRELWRFATERFGQKSFHNPYPDPYADDIPIGIKHGIGKCAGGGHYGNLDFQDENYEWLRAAVGSEAVEFYRTMKL